MQSHTQQPVPSKDKTIAIVLAVFLSFWTWLYTYKKSKKKFWIALIIVGSIVVITIFGVVVEFFIIRAENTETTSTIFALISLIQIFLGIAWILSLPAIYIWAIIDAATKPEAWYKQWP